MASVACGQAGVSSLSVGFANAGYAGLPSPELVRIEEFVNYHRHAIGLPEHGQRVALSAGGLQLGNGDKILPVRNCHSS